MIYFFSPTLNTYFNSFKTLIFNNTYVWVDSISDDETVFLDVDAISSDTCAGKVPAQLG